MAIATDPYLTLLQDLAPERARLLAHPVYRSVADVRALRSFMEAHVFAVWDFMSLLKALQRSLTCVEVPWVPPRSRTAARLVNEIVLGEESDEVAPGVTMSHFELYLDAMKEVGADTGPIAQFVDVIRRGASTDAAFGAVSVSVPAHARRFVRETLRTIRDGSIEAIAASFLVGREDLVPAMFRRLLASVERSRSAVSLRHYLARHIEADEGAHGPLARRLLGELCGEDEVRWRAATEAARSAIVARAALWDGVAAALPEARAEAIG